MVRLLNGCKEGTIKHSFMIFLFLSIIHIVIASIHLRESGIIDHHNIMQIV